MFRKIVLLAALLSTFYRSVATARTWHINADGTGEAPTIQAGIDSATAGDIVLVAPGTYSSTVQVQVDGQPTAVNAYVTKDISLRSENGPSVTKIDGTASSICILLVSVGSGAEVSGFEITIAPEMIGCLLFTQRSGQRNNQKVPFDRIAIRCDGSSCTIRDNVIHDADVGVRLNTSPATITDNAFENVGIGVEGTESDALVTQNSATTSFGEAFDFMNSSPTIQNNIMRGSSTAYSCVGIACVSSGPASSFTPTISGNTIEYVASQGIWCNGVSATIIGNKIKWTGIAAAVINYSYVSFTGNIVIQTTSGLILQYSEGAIEENTFVDVGIDLIGNATISRNILFGTAAIIGFSGSTPNVTCNDVFAPGTTITRGTSATDSNGNFSLDPEFCGIGGSDNYYLQSDSPCAPGNHPQGVDCGRIGAFDAKCGTVRVRPVTWGQIKALYRR
jgi:hypothetical protein